MTLLRYPFFALIVALLTGVGMPSLSAAAEHSRELVVGVENQSYLPLSSYEKGVYGGFARALLDAFAREQGFTLRYQALPVPRLYAAFFQGEVDFKFPDHPEWKKPDRAGRTIAYSLPVVTYIDGVSVRPGSKGAGADRIRVLGTVAGFTPWAWQDRLAAGKATLSENTTSEGLVRQTLAGRVDGAYASVAVINYQLDHVLKTPGALVFDPALPHSRDSYHLSSLKHPELIAAFDQWLKQNARKVAALKHQYAVEKGVRPE